MYIKLIHFSAFGLHEDRVRLCGVSVTSEVCVFVIRTFYCVKCNTTTLPDLQTFVIQPNIDILVIDRVVKTSVLVLPLCSIFSCPNQVSRLPLVLPLSTAMYLQRSTQTMLGFGMWLSPSTGRCIFVLCPLIINCSICSTYVNGEKHHINGFTARYEIPRFLVLILGRAFVFFCAWCSASIIANSAAFPIFLFDLYEINISVLACTYMSTQIRLPLLKIHIL